MTKADLQEYIRMLRSLGLDIPHAAMASEVAAVIGRSGFARKPKEPIEVLINRFLRQRGQPEYKGEIVPSRTPPKFREYKPKPHPRQADMRQPKLWTPNGVGNGAEGQNGYGRGS